MHRMSQMKAAILNLHLSLHLPFPRRLHSVCYNPSDILSDLIAGKDHSKMTLSWALYEVVAAETHEEKIYD